MKTDQLRTILWLRWRLTRNQWARSSGIGAVIAAVVAISSIALGAMIFIITLAVGAFALSDARPMSIMIVWLGMTLAFLFLWAVGVVNEIQRSEMIDLQRLMHLPVALGPMFVINYLASLLTFGTVLVVPAMVGLSIGLTVSRGFAMLLLLPLALGMVFMVTAWTYYLKGWLSALMSNPRRRRTVIVCITAVFVLLAQAPNIYFNLLGFGRMRPPVVTPPGMFPSPPQHDLFGGVHEWMVYVPPLWVPVGAEALAEGQFLTALLGALGCAAVGALGLWEAYRSTMRFYYGQSGGAAAASAPTRRESLDVPAPSKIGSRFIELRIPGLPEQASAVALATLRSMLRAPEVKMAWASSFFITLVGGTVMMFRLAPHVSEAVKPFIATAAVAISVFMLIQFFANPFGFDRDGFRAWVLSPVDRRFILLGKNAACLPVGVCFGVALLSVITILLHLSPLTVLAALFQLMSLLFVAGLVGNLLSILVPYRIQAGSMKPTKVPGLTMLFILLCHLLCPIVMAPLFVPPLAELLWHMFDLPAAGVINLLFSVVFAGLLALAYWHSLAPLGRLLQRRETRILSVVTSEVE